MGIATASTVAPLLWKSYPGKTRIFATLCILKIPGTLFPDPVQACFSKDITDIAKPYESINCPIMQHAILAHETYTSPICGRQL